ncbi:hypothetical protein CAPTEDRAFT_114631 [Capitella teleta]|uniref:tRNA N(3)-methylcytidine methyltransferase n=1 Tax=Capitella teleta TaxID=283909 RepID=R7TTQ9_CAPTE|nr:hypothetical protein CAPTEDRAFT_114631 [Capitella teleta]|eukprot:ELT97002.1 hypothetical protein CAPTEDRAFT_114631 [Capitella teleta]
MEKRPQFGNRVLTNPENVFQHNAWDNVEWDEEQEAEAESKVAKNSATKYEDDADQFWDKFYLKHQNRFYKDRQWLFTEFPELAPEGVPSESTPQRVLTEGAVSCPSDPTPFTLTSPASAASEDSFGDFPGKTSKTRFFEVGCGVGNTVFPVLKTNNDPNLFVYCCDLSANAIQLVHENPEYAGGRCHGFVADVSSPSCQLPFPENSLDLIILIFVLSAVHPEKMQETISGLAKYLKPGGKILFRDYGRYDLAQLRFKDGQCLQDNFYVRGEGTRVYFFTQEELREMFVKAGLKEEQNITDRRLQVNRQRQLKMYRIWIQCKYSKPLESF